MPRKSLAVLVSKRNWQLPMQSIARGLAEFSRELWLSLIVKSDQTFVEGRIPES
jgi:hypothetical protein